MTIFKKCQGLATVILLLFISFKASAIYAEEVKSSDPLEGFNRGMFAFNDKVDVFFLKPIATLYNKIVPKPLNAGIHNFYNNINELPTIANDILQFKFYQTANDTWRFIVNSTLGIGGLFDIGTRIGLSHYINDFGLTMANYGWRESTYFVVPFFGPSTIRDTIEIPVDYYAFSLYPHVEPESARWTLYGVGVVDRRAQLLKIENVMDEAAFDRYSFIRNAYLQRRAYQIEQNDHRSALELYQARKGVVGLGVQESFKPTPDVITPKLNPVRTYARPTRPDTSI